MIKKLKRKTDIYRILFSVKNKRAFFVRPLDGAWQSYKSEKNGYTVKFTFINQLDRDDLNVSVRKKQAKEFIKLIESYLNESPNGFNNQY